MPEVGEEAQGRGRSWELGQGGSVESLAHNIHYRIELIIRLFNMDNPVYIHVQACPTPESFTIRLGN